MTSEWVPGADAEALDGRARLLRSIREFFFQRGVMEVVTPVLGARGVTDVHIENISAGARYLQTSPEYFMKRLLAAGAGPVYQMGPVFRGAESGRHHNMEFTMLEWYRPGFDLRALAAELAELLGTLFEAFGTAAGPVSTSRYKDLFAARWHKDPHTADTGTLKSLAAALPQSHIVDHGDTGTRNDYLDLLFTQGVQHDLAGPGIVMEYPASQAALAVVAEDEQGERVALRFECIWQGVELANGYYELRDADELARRMAENNDQRAARGLPRVLPDEKLLAALPQMPACSGVALGIDRLLMLLLGRKRLEDVITFSDARL